jgi:alkaline phosphatase D
MSRSSRRPPAVPAVPSSDAESSPLRVDRRRFLELGGAAAVGAVALACGTEDDGPKLAPPEPPPSDGAVPRSFDPQAVPADERNFPLGVQAGGMTSTGAVLWSFTEDDRPKRLLVWRDSKTPGEILVAHESVVEPADGYLKTRIEGLGAGHYRYAFFDDVDGAPRTRSRLGRFRTAFADGDLRPLTLLGLTCTSLRNAPWKALEKARGVERDLIVHLGDMSYNDVAEDLPTYRREWRKTLGAHEYRDNYAMAGLYATWDDHEFANNLDPESMPAERIADAKQAFYETLAVEEAGEDRHIWRSYRWGATAEFFILDCRTERLPSTRNGAGAQYVSPAQMAWLEQALLDSPCKFKILLNSVPMARMGGFWEAANFDRWQGYEAQRQRLVDHLVNNDIRGVLFLSGDFHFGFVAKVEPTGPASRYLEVAVGPTGNGPNPLPALAMRGDIPADEIMPPETFVHYSASPSVVTTITLDPLNDRVHLRNVDARPDRDGEVLFDGELPIVV